MGNKISFVIPEDLKKEINNLKDLYKEEQSSLIRRLLWRSINEEKPDFAIKEYLNENISMGKAAEIAGISIWEMLDELKKRNISLKYKISEAQAEIENLLKKYEK